MNALDMMRTLADNGAVVNLRADRMGTWLCEMTTQGRLGRGESRGDPEEAVFRAACDHGGKTYRSALRSRAPDDERGPSSTQVLQ